MYTPTPILEWGYLFLLDNAVTDSVIAAAEQENQNNQDPDPFAVIENIAEASHSFILSFHLHGRRRFSLRSSFCG